jgi:hypothetical protein
MQEKWIPLRIRTIGNKISERKEYVASSQREHKEGKSRMAQNGNGQSKLTPSDQLEFRYEEI